MMRYSSHNNLQTVTRSAIVAAVMSTLVCCIREPELHLFEAEPTNTRIVFAELELDTYWDYELEVGVRYEWRNEWYYGWDEEDERIWGDIGYTMPNVFNIRRYFTGSTPYAPHTRVIQNTIEGNTFQGEFNYGFWDMLVFNDIKLRDGVQSLNFDETTTLDSITVYTNQSMVKSRYYAQRYTHALLLRAGGAVLGLRAGHRDYPQPRGFRVRRRTQRLGEAPQHDTPPHHLYIPDAGHRPP